MRLAASPAPNIGDGFDVGQSVLSVAARIDQPGFFVPLHLLVFSLPAEPSRGPVAAPPETTVWMDRIVVDPPLFCQNLRFLRRVEQLAVQELRAHFSIKRFDIAVFPRGARLNVEWLTLQGLQPATQFPGNKLRSVVGPNVLRHAVV